MRSVGHMRVYVTIALRSLAIMLLLIGIYGMVQALLFYRSSGLFMIQYESGFTWIGFALGYLAGGIALAAASGWLVTWLVPVRRNECPQCGYALRNLQSDRCPECSLARSDHLSQEGRGESTTD